MPVGVGQGDPELDAVERAGAGVETSEWLMPWPAVIRFSSPGRTMAWLPDAVAVLDLAGEEPAHRLQSGVRVRRHVHPARRATSSGP